MEFQKNNYSSKKKNEKDEPRTVAAPGRRAMGSVQQLPGPGQPGHWPREKASPLEVNFDDPVGTGQTRGLNKKNLMTSSLLRVISQQYNIVYCLFIIK